VVLNADKDTMTEVIEDADAEVIGKVVEESIEAGTTDVLE